MTVTRKTFNQPKTTRLQSKMVSQSPESRLYHWVGLHDLYKAWKGYQNKDYPSAQRSAAIGSLKLGVLAAACYGVYKWASGDVIHINDFITQAEKDFQSQGGSAFMPASAKKFIDSMYEEAKNFTKWPKCGQKFILKHLEEDAPMSSAIIKHLFEEAAVKGDRTFERYSINACRKSGATTKSCLTAADLHTGEANPDGLRNAMSLASRCKKISNAFCERALENAKTLSLSQKSIRDVITLANLLTRPKADLEKSKGFVELAANMFDQEMKVLKSAIDDCEKMKTGEKSAGKLCYSRATRFKTAEAWSYWIAGKSDEWKKNYGKEQAASLQDERKENLANYVDFSKACSKMSDFLPCQQHVDQSIAIFRAHEESLKKSAGDCKNVDLQNEDSWNRCYSHADFWDRLELFDAGSWRRTYWAEKKDRELNAAPKDAMAHLGVGLAEASAKFPNSQTCKGFLDEAVKKLFDNQLLDDALKLVTNAKEAITPILVELTQKREWEQGIKLILSFAKKNPSVDIQSETSSFWNSLIHSSEGYRAFELLSLNDQLDIKKTLVHAFEKKHEDHLHKIYLLAKSWIAKKEKKYDEHLKFIIQELFKANPSRWSFDTLEEEMAKALVTKWMKSLDSSSIDSNEKSWRLQSKPGSEWDRYSSAITAENWENKLSDLLHN
jgi:hypothetical protein